MVVTGVAGLALVGSVAGVARGLPGVTKWKSESVSTTYHVSDVPNGPDNATSVQLGKVGRVRITGGCTAYAVEGSPAPYHVSMKIGVQNTGPDRVAFMVAPQDADIAGVDASTAWIPGYGSDAILAGEVVNEEFPDGNTGFDSLAIIDREGRSAATGLIAWEATVTGGGTGECTFSLQMKG
jgi:hypothetical protein